MSSEHGTRRSARHVNAFSGACFKLCVVTLPRDRGSVSVFTGSQLSHVVNTNRPARAISSLSCHFADVCASEAGVICRKCVSTAVYSGRIFTQINRMHPIIPRPCWLAMPAERSAAFLPAFVRMSVAIQSVLREQVPVEYFKDSGKYRDLKTAALMLVYQASPPFRGKKRAELTYDVLNPALIALLFRRAKPALVELLVQAETRLRIEGLTDLADRYAPRRSAAILDCVQKLSKSRRHLYVLIRAESVLLDALVQLSGLGNLSPKVQAKKWATFEKRWKFQLRRFYQGSDFTHLAPILLDVAENALLAETLPRLGILLQRGEEALPLLDEADPA